MANRRNFRSSRWAALVVLLIAGGMIFSSIPFFVHDYLSRNRDQAEYSDLDSLMRYIEQETEALRQEAEQLESHIEEYGPMENTLGRLAGVYHTLINYLSLLDPDQVDELQERLLQAYLELVELVPDDPNYRFSLVFAYRHAGEEDLAYEEAVKLMELLERRLVEGSDNLDRYYHAVMLAEFRDDREAAMEYINLILESEDQESDLYAYARDFKEHLEDEPDDDEQTD